MEILKKKLLKEISKIVKLINKIIEILYSIPTRWKFITYLFAIFFSLTLYFLGNYSFAKFSYTFGIVGILYLVLNICKTYMESMGKDIGIKSIILILVTIPVLQINFLNKYFIVFSLIPLIRFILCLFSFCKKKDSYDLLCLMFSSSKMMVNIILILDLICILLCSLIFGYVLSVPNIEIKIIRLVFVFFVTCVSLFVFVKHLKNIILFSTNITE